jgi:transcription elongation factor Elf1
MKTVKSYTVETIEVECPECNEISEISEEEFEFVDGVQIQIVICDSCETEFQAIHPDY